MVRGRGPGSGCPAGRTRPGGASSTRRDSVRPTSCAYAGQQGHLDRAQRLVLLAAEAGELAEVARTCSLTTCPTTSCSRSRRRASSPTSATRRRGRAARELLRIRDPRPRAASSARSCGSCRRDRLRPRADRGVSRAAAAHDDRGCSRSPRSAASGCRARSTSRSIAERPVRHAIEPRDHSFDDPEFAAILGGTGVAAVLGDAPDAGRSSTG